MNSFSFLLYVYLVILLASPPFSPQLDHAVNYIKLIHPLVSHQFSQYSWILIKKKISGQTLTFAALYLYMIEEY